MDFNKEIIFSSSEPNFSRKLSQAEIDGKLRKIAPRIYTTNLLDAPENIIRRNFFEILAWRFPGAVISHRSAIELSPTQEGHFFMTSSYNRRITDLPGLTINIYKGKPALNSDTKFNGLYISSEYRYVLENLQVSRKTKDGTEKNLPQSVIEERLERMILLGDEERLNDFRDKTREIAKELGMMKEFEKLSIIISALLNTHSSDSLESDTAKARAAGNPFDKNRIELFEILFEQLKDRFFTERRDRNDNEASFRMFSFFESYFSNYIEGTKFEINEAKQIVDTGVTIPKRVDDSHDILGTFAVLSNRHEMQKSPQTANELIALLKHRHRIMMSGRPELNPGLFKQINNQAGSTVFVDYRHVEGTLQYGFRYFQLLKEPLAKAIYMMFLISEVHPFLDGNGRIARIMMNAELVCGEQSRIIIPTVFREDYLLALRKLSRKKDPETYIRIMEKLHHFSDNLYGQDFDELNRYLQASNAYDDPEEGKLQWIDRNFSSKSELLPDFDSLPL